MKQETKHRNLLPLIAAVVVIAAAAVTLMPKATADEESPTQVSQPSENGPLADSGDLVIQTGDIGTEASYFDYDANGTTVQVFAVQASDGTIRLALNTCQVCHGSPYAYFVQDGTIVIPAAFLEENAALFTNWKNF